MIPIISLQEFKVGISQHTADIKKEEPEHRFPEMAIYVLTRNKAGTSIIECKKSHAGNSLEISEKKKGKMKPYFDTQPLHSRDIL